MRQGCGFLALSKKLQVLTIYGLSQNLVQNPSNFCVYELEEACLCLLCQLPHS